MNQNTYSVEGMHCPSCEMIIERKLMKQKGVASADASMATNEVKVVYEGDKLSADELNRLFAGSGYTFMINPHPEKSDLLSGFAKPLALLSVIVAAFFAISSSRLSSLVMITPESTYSALFLFGLVAGISSCAALTGGLVLSLSSTWLARGGEKSSITEKLLPHVLFNAGRIGAYSLFGALLGFAGETIRISPYITGAAVVVVSLLMLALALQMLGFTLFNRVRIALPKKLFKNLFSEKSESKTTHPALSGVMTLLLPCGFTMIAEGAAMLSGGALSGMLVMLFFVLGTTPALVGIGISSIRFSTNRKTSPIFTKTAGLLIIFFVMYNLNVQFDFSRHIPASQLSQSVLPDSSEAIAGESTIHETLRTVYTSAKDISPSRFDVKAGQKIRFIVDAKDTGTGCMSTIMVPGLWEKPERLVKGKSIVMEFTPMKPGAYKITCAMGVPRGVINVQ